MQVLRWMILCKVVSERMMAMRRRLKEAEVEA
jgi:hypothetical protein